MAINKIAILLALLVPSISAACPETGVGKFSKKLFYKQEDLQSGEIEGVQIGWTSTQLRQHLSDQGVEKVEFVPANDFYATDECPEELEKIIGSTEILVKGKNQEKIAIITMADAQVAEIDTAKSSEAPINKGDSVSIVISKLKDLLESGKAQSVTPVLSCICGQVSASL